MAADLDAKKPRIIRNLSRVNQVGDGQAIYFDCDPNVLLGASDLREDGCAIGY